MLSSVKSDRWRAIAEAQNGLMTRSQLGAIGIDRWAVAHQISADRWAAVAPTVISIAPGPLRADQRPWLGVLAGGPGALLGGLHAAAVDGLRNWHRDVVQVYVPYGHKPDIELDGVVFIRTRRPLAPLASARSGISRLRLEPGLLLWASTERSTVAAEGVLAAAVQQRLTTPTVLAKALDDLPRLRRSPRFRARILEIAGGAHSLAEGAVSRMCRHHGLTPPVRQVRRRDASGRIRFTDCEWHLPDGRCVVLEVDGAFHMDVDMWEEDIARARALSDPRRTAVRCTARELRDDEAVVARDLIRLGVPRVTPGVTHRSRSVSRGEAS